MTRTDPAQNMQYFTLVLKADFARRFLSDL